MNCPLCKAREVGRIGRERYYCRECCHEWTKGDGDGVVKIYEVLSDGSVERLESSSESRSLTLPQRVTRRRAG